MDIGENVVFTLCLVKTAAASVVAEDIGFNKDEVVSIGEDDVTVTLATVVKDCSTLIFVPSEVPVKFAGGVYEGTSRGDVEDCGTYAVVFSVIDSNEPGANIVSPSGFTCASFVGSVLVAISANSIILVLTGISVVLSISGVPVKAEVATDLLSDSVLVVTACVAAAA